MCSLLSCKWDDAARVMHRSCGCKILPKFSCTYIVPMSNLRDAVLVFLIKLIHRKTVFNTLIEILLQETEIRWPDISKCVTEDPAAANSRVPAPHRRPHREGLQKLAPDQQLHPPAAGSSAAVRFTFKCNLVIMLKLAVHVQSSCVLASLSNTKLSRLYDTK